MSTKFERIATSVPQDATAARVTSRGFQYTPDKQLPRSHRDTPPPMGPIPDLAPRLIGVKFGRFTVIGWCATQGSKGNWVVRCVCGAYETRTTRAVRNPKNATVDCCAQCRHVIWLRNHDTWKRTGQQQSNNSTGG